MLRAHRLCGRFTVGCRGSRIDAGRGAESGVELHIRTLFSRQGAKIMYKTALRASEGTWYLREDAELPFPGSP